MLCMRALFIFGFGFGLRVLAFPFFLFFVCTLCPRRRIFAEVDHIREIAGIVFCAIMQPLPLVGIFDPLSVYNFYSHNIMLLSTHNFVQLIWLLALLQSHLVLLCQYYQQLVYIHLHFLHFERDIANFHMTSLSISTC